MFRRVVTSTLFAAYALYFAAGGNCAFKDPGFGARPSGMGGAFVAVSDDSNAPLYNPAGICQVKNREVSFMYAKPYLGLENIDLGLMHLSVIFANNRFGSFGLNWESFDGAKLYREDTIMLSYAFKVNSNIFMGMNAKYLSHKYNWDEKTILRAVAAGDMVVTSGDSAKAITADFGMLFKIKDRFSFGLAAKNLTQPNVGIYYEDQVPLEARAGISYKISRWGALEDFTYAFDASYRDQKWGDLQDRNNYYFGMETWLSRHTFALRTGLNKNEASFGGSICRPLGRNIIFQVDYSFVGSFNIRDNYGTHRISTSVRF